MPGLPPILQSLRLPMVGAPMFLVSGPDLVIAQCKAGIVGSFPALNARDEDGDATPMLERWLTRITGELDRHNQANPDRPAAPFAVNQIVHRSNERLMRDVEICAKWRVPLWITSLGARPEVNAIAHEAGGFVMHDIINDTFARKAIDKGADALIAVAAGAGGHAGPQSPFALLSEIRAWFDGPVLLSGCIATGRSLLAAQVMGADLGYVGSPFIATVEAQATDDYKTMIVDSSAEDIVNSAAFTGIPGNYLKPSITRAGLDADTMLADAKPMDFSKGSAKPRAWRDIWGSGMGIGAVREVVPVAALVDRIETEYRTACAEVLPTVERGRG